MPVEVCFPEDEVSAILWVLNEASVLAEETGLFSSLALFEQTQELVRRRYDERGRE